MPGLLQPERELEWSPDDRLIRVRVKSFFTQKWNAMECDPAHPRAITRAQYDAWQAGQHIQHAMPQLRASEREFLLTGATPEEWDAEFGGDDE